MDASLSSRIAAAVSSAVLVIGLLATLLGFDPMRSSIDENRTRTAPPTAPVQQWQTYVDQANAYIGDNFGLRSVLIRSHALFREHVLNANSSDNVFLDAMGLDGN
jgi:hypothetical protein